MTETNAIVMRRVSLQNNISVMEFATTAEEEMHHRLTREIIELSEKLRPLEKELWILHRARTRLFWVWKARQKRARREEQDAQQ